MFIGWHCLLNFIVQSKGGKSEPLVHLRWEDAGTDLSLVWFINFWCQNNLHFSGGECGPSSFKSCHPVWRLWWRRRGYVEVLKPDHLDWDSRGYHSLCRPFGVAILFAGMDDNGTQLYHMDPSGTYLQVGLATEMVLACSPLMRLWLIVTFAFQFDAKAIGSGSEGAQQSLQEVWIFWNYIPENISPCNLLLGLPQEHDPKGGHKVCFHHPEAGAYLIDELLNLSLTIKDELQKCALAARHSHVPLLQVMEEKLNETNVEAARVTPQGGFQMIKGEELESIIKELAWVLLCAAANSNDTPFMPATRVHCSVCSDSIWTSS